MNRIQAIGAWSISIEPHFKTKHNQDSWQAFDEDRFIYISATSVNDHNGLPVPAKALSQIAKNQLINSDSSIIEFEKSDLFGSAVIIKNEEGYQLNGFVCALGSIATCVIEYIIQEDEVWAKEVWESLSHSEPQR